MFFYMKVKGEVERDIRALALPSLAIYQPGLIVDRRNDYRFGEKVASFIPFIDKIRAADLGNFILRHTICVCQNEPGSGADAVTVLSNGTMVRDLASYLQAEEQNRPNL
mmetsp:Transcript_336/g.496  ORF Transcript_336/g.496 Transcript_336/m.496 type:complete len:109 (+) Transcript_336:395-721(+)